MDRYLLANRYELIDKIGSGGMATVYRARCQTLDRIVAVKVLKDELAADPSLVSRFKSEALAAARLSHPNLVNIFDVGEDNGIHYIVMEYIEGRTLRDVISEQRSLSPSQAVNIAAMVCDGLEHAHSRGLIHRDIKPHNILVTNDGNVKIADFGIARVVSTSTITYGTNIMGSVYYISPEQAKGETTGPETDIYSLGCVLYEMVTGKPIFDGDSPITVALKHVHEEPISPRVLNPAIPGGLERVILRAVAKDPAVRYHSASDMKEALIRYSDLPLSSRNKSKADVQTIPMDEKENKNRIFNKSNIIWVVVALLGLTLGLLTTNRDMIFGKEVSVPDVKGMTQKEAFEQLKDKDLKMRVLKQVTSDQYDAGRIISQNPEAEEMVKTGREIEVVVSKGGETVEVPRLIGKDLGVATSLLQEAGLEIGEVERTFDEDEVANTVLEQDPGAGKEVKSGSKINLVVSKGAKPTASEVPDVVGMYLSEAKGTLEAAGLVLGGDIKKVESDKYFTGQVTLQDPKAGSEAEQGTQVNLTVSKGPGPEAERTTINYTLPPDQDYYQVQMVLKDAKGERTIYSGLNRANETVQVVVSYYGQGEVTVYLNSQAVKKYEI